MSTTRIQLLFISFKFVKGFLAIAILLLLISSFHDVCQRFFYMDLTIDTWRMLLIHQ